ncbi:MAG: hypothetical protein H7306_03055 [Bacteriovorax sp.]|nr:hypothetical protein [Rhizobacter sp.]
MTRQLLRTICRALIGVVWVAQMAVAAYACPGVARSAAMAMQMQMTSDTASDAGVADASPTMDCEGMTGPMDPDFANLCAEHCHHGQQSDQASTLNVPAVLLTALYDTSPAPVPGASPGAAVEAASSRVAAPPPHTLLHCCLRI